MDGTNVLRLTNNPTLDDQPSWSPDGTKLAVVSQRDEGLGVYLLDRNGLNPQFVITNLIADAPVSWSPDGEILVFQSTSGPEDQDIFSVRLDGSDLKQLTDAEGWDQNPAWQPDPEFAPVIVAPGPVPTSTALPTVDPNAAVFTDPTSAPNIPPTAPANVECTLFAFHNVLKRDEPSFDAGQFGAVPAEKRVTAVAQAVDPDGKIWWQLEDGYWVFSEVINEQGNCNALPIGDVG
jgi:dipeptidyl aminopeptidase/acylaminoacyl peptidase